MTTFDKLKGAAATLADAAVKTTGDLAQKGKKQMDLLALENKLSRAQRQLGALVYALHKNGEENTALVERYIETIAAVEKDIAALEPAPAAAMADDAQTAVYCPQCGALFCPLACAHGAWCPRKKNGSAQFGAADVKKARGWGQIREKKGQTTCKVRAYHVKSME